MESCRRLFDRRHEGAGPGSDLLGIVVEAGGCVSEIPRKESWTLLRAWRKLYCAPVPAAFGKRILGVSGGYSWHTFSHNHFPHVAGRQALQEYSAQPARELLVLPERSSSAAFRCSSAVPPDSSRLRFDVYVAPSDFAWTMVFTHENEWYGPYFSRAEWGERGVFRS
ncbi:DUF4275 family protein [Pelagibius sp.]|uniref:DUF4275 family protein n=1 Tax=Pelagibius sp. TaxID=1931238 RepID=UPI0026134764|nr:DUF4275 family protein [Pelagibius sp.]